MHMQVGNMTVRFLDLLEGVDRLEDLTQAGLKVTLAFDGSDVKVGSHMPMD